MLEISSRSLTLLILLSLNVAFLEGQFQYLTTTTADPLQPLLNEIFNISWEGDTPNSNNRTSFPNPTTASTCNCVPINQCHQYNNSVLNSGEGLIDIKIGLCPQSLDICCDQKITSTNTRPPPTFVRNVKCGYRNEDGVGFKITAGNFEAQFGEFPWMVAVLKVKSQNGRDVTEYHCGGALIHPKVVLTAAHCVISYEKQPNKVIIRAGEWDSQSEAEILPFQERVAQKIIIHRDFKSGPLFNDVALVILKENFDFNDNVDIVCLPNQNENVDFQNCVASGWGKDQFGEKGVYQNILKRVDLPVVPYEECLNRLRQTRLGPKFVLHESFLCAGGVPKQDTCKGDGGSPLVCPIPGNKDHYQQVGIVSWGIGCGNNVPGIYVSIPHLRSWIDEQFIDNNLPLMYHNEKYD